MTLRSGNQVPPSPVFAEAQETYADSWLLQFAVTALSSSWFDESHFTLLPAHSRNAVYFEPQFASFLDETHWLAWSCVIGVSAEQTVEPTAGQLPEAAELAALDELEHAALAQRRTAPRNITRFFIWIKPPVESVLTAGRMSHSRPF
jgi:hypothetical protein